jgi:hypothetical protein
MFLTSDVQYVSFRKSSIISAYFSYESCKVDMSTIYTDLYNELMLFTPVTLNVKHMAPPRVHTKSLRGHSKVTEN